MLKNIVIRNLASTGSSEAYVEPGAIPPPSGSAAPRSRRRMKIPPRRSVLVVEDESSILELIKYNLLLNAFSVHGATTGEAALASARERRPDAVLLDLMLPGIDGYEVCRRLKVDPDTATIPVIIVSARSGEGDIAKAYECGADGYVVKPFSPRHLVDKVMKAIRPAGPSDPSDAARS